MVFISKGNPERGDSCGPKTDFPNMTNCQNFAHREPLKQSTPMKCWDIIAIFAKNTLNNTSEKHIINLMGLSVVFVIMQLFKI